MLEAIFSGIISAAFVLVPTYLQERVSVVSWTLPIFILGIGIWNAFFDRYLTRKNLLGARYDGLADIFIYIYSPMASVPFLRWLSRAIVSFSFAICGGSVGVEGAAIEMAQAYRVGSKTRSSRWFEQRRRSEVSMALAGGISAAFQAPFAGVLLPMELGVGGRSFFSIVASLSAFVAVKTAVPYFSMTLLNLQSVPGDFSVMSVKNLFEFVVMGVASGLVGAGVIKFFEFIKNGFLKIYGSYVAIGSLVASGILILGYLIYPAGHQPSWVLLGNVISGSYTSNELGFLFSLELLGLSIILAGFGTMGVFWPILMMGGVVGLGVHQVFFEGLFPQQGNTMGLVGASAFFAALFGAPVTGAISVYEMTQNFQILLPSLLSGLLARQVCKALNVPNYLSSTLEARGHSFQEGRSTDILESIKVEQAMVMDYQAVAENEPLFKIKGKILESRYPFLPVVNSRSEFVGLLTIDMVEEGWKTQMGQGRLSLNSLLEAKDLLLRAKNRIATLKQGDSLGMTQRLFDEIPCIPVLTDDGRLIGLLFVHNVRLAYDREVTRRSMT